MTVTTNHHAATPCRACKNRREAKAGAGSVSCGLLTQGQTCKNAAGEWTLFEASNVSASDPRGPRLLTEG